MSCRQAEKTSADIVTETTVTDKDTKADFDVSTKDTKNDTEEDTEESAARRTEKTISRRRLQRRNSCRFQLTVTSSVPLCSVAFPLCPSWIRREPASVSLTARVTSP